jgi:NAD(P)H-hydrate epimerase
VFSLDIPSGLDADTGLAHGGLAVRAARTLAFVALKSGYYLGDAPDHVGALEFAGLGIPDALRAPESPVLRRLTGTVAARALPARLRSAHKSSHGRITIVGGYAMAGAARLAGEAALRAGAGLVTVVTSAGAAPAIVAGRPELVVRVPRPLQDIDTFLDADAVAVGPGMGNGPEAVDAIDRVLQREGNVVVDADALNRLASRPRKAPRWILTPHPGEAARMLGIEAIAVQRDRLAAVRAIVGRFGGTCVLKGANTLVHGDAPVPWVCDGGNPGMATAGSGDVLTGVIAALVADTRDPLLAAQAAVLLHAEAGDRAARAGMRGMTAGDIVAELRAVVNAPWS